MNFSTHSTYRILLPRRNGKSTTWAMPQAAHQKHRLKTAFCSSISFKHAETDPWRRSQRLRCHGEELQLSISLSKAYDTCSAFKIRHCPHENRKVCCIVYNSVQKRTIQRHCVFNKCSAEHYFSSNRAGLCAEFVDWNMSLMRTWLTYKSSSLILEKSAFWLSNTAAMPMPTKPHEAPARYHSWISA